MAGVAQHASSFDRLRMRWEWGLRQDGYWMRSLGCVLVRPHLSVADIFSLSHFGSDAGRRTLSICHPDDLILSLSKDEDTGG